jgi:hypothetical protein
LKDTSFILFIKSRVYPFCNYKKRGNPMAIVILFQTCLRVFIDFILTKSLTIDNVQNVSVTNLNGFMSGQLIWNLIWF